MNMDELIARMEERLEQLRDEYGAYDHYTDGFEDALDIIEAALAEEVGP